MVRQARAAEKSPLSRRRKIFYVITAGFCLIILFFLSHRFLLGIMVIYALPGIYLHSWLKRFFFGIGPRKTFSIVYLLLIASFPLAELLAHSANSLALKYILIIGYYSLPFLLYLFLLVALYDLLLLINRLVNFIPRETLQSRPCRITSLCLLLALTLAIVVKGSIHFDDIQVNEYRIEVSRKSSALQQLRIALAADFHLGELTRRRFMEKFVARVNALQPDIVLIPGDVLEGDRRDAAYAEFERQFRRLRTRYGVYASLGNHEFHGATSQLLFFHNAHIQVLANTFVVIDQGFILAGRNDAHHESKKPLAELLQDAPDLFPIILLDHRPPDLAELSHNLVSIVLSAHTHNGQFFPFNYLSALQFPLSWGYRKVGQVHLFVTSGIQAWGPRVRTAGEAEIMLIDVLFTDKAPTP